MPVVLHGFYVFCLRTESLIFFILFAVYLLLLTVITIKQFIEFSGNDTLIPGMEWTVSVDDRTWEEAPDESKM